MRLLICDLVGEPITRASMATLREDVADLTERLAQSEETARALEHRSKYLLLVLAFLHRYLELHLELVDIVGRELSGSPGSEETPRSAASSLAS